MDIETDRYTRSDAKALIKKQEYSLAKEVLEALWDKSEKNDRYLLYDYGQALRKVNESAIFIEICRELFGSTIINNTYIKSCLCWCLYDVYIKNYTVDNKDGFKDFIKRAEYIVENSEQKGPDEHFKTPYIITIKKVVKILNERPSKNYNQIIKWLSNLDTDRLSDEVFSFSDQDGKDRELASPKEFYYQHMAKALEKTEKYDECIQVCESAFSQIRKFHYRNHIWLKARLYYSRCMLNMDIEKAIEEYKGLAYKENFWFMYHKLSQICFRYNKIADALLYASKAMVCKFEHEKMVNLLLDAAQLWQANGNNSYAKIFFQASAYYRAKQEWSIPEELDYAISTLELDKTTKPNIRELQKISETYILQIEGTKERASGKVQKVFEHGGSGFIKLDSDGSGIYFNMKDSDQELIRGEKVHFEVLIQKDGKPKAINISKRG